MYDNIKELEYVKARDVFKANELLKNHWIILNTFQEKNEQENCGYILFAKLTDGWENYPRLDRNDP